jgi:hypothetical protein
MGEVGNESETIPGCDWRAFAGLAGNLSHGVFRVLQHNRRKADIRSDIDVGYVPEAHEVQPIGPRTEPVND